MYVRVGRQQKKYRKKHFWTPRDHEWSHLEPVEQNEMVLELTKGVIPD